MGRLLQSDKRQHVIKHVPQIEQNVCQHIVHYNDTHSQLLFLSQLTLGVGVVPDEDLQNCESTAESHTVRELQDGLDLVHVVDVVLGPSVGKGIGEEQIVDSLENLSDVASAARGQTLIGEHVDHTVSETIEQILGVGPPIEGWEWEPNSGVD